jgi:hypothetical protein
MTTLPAPVLRYLRHALGDEGPVPSGVRVTMAGRIKVGRWLAFDAEQEFCGHDYEWRARAGFGQLKALRVVDRYAAGSGSTEGRLFGRLRFMHADDENTARASAGRAGAESVWVPGTLLPGPGVSWRAESDELIVADVFVAPEQVELRLRIDGAGAVRSMSIMRWGDVGQDGFGYIPFGGEVRAERRFGSLVIPSELTVGWWYGTPSYDPFFEATLLSATATGQAPSSRPWSSA